MDAYHSQRGQGPQKGQNDHDTREPDALKGARPVRRGAVRKGLTGDITLSETGTVSGSISTSLAAYSTKLVTTALEWSYAAGETDVRAETLEKAAELLILRRDTLRIIDGAGPSVEVQESDPTTQGSRTEPEQEAVPPTQQQDTTETVGDQKQPTKPTKCTFSGVVPIEAQRFLDGGTLIVECPECAATRSLEPRRGVLRFPSHDKRKTRTTPPGQRWVKRETAWEVA